MVTRWIHLEQLGGDSWVLPIWAAHNAAAGAGTARPIPVALSELAIHVSTRLSILPTVVERINASVQALHEAVKEAEPEHIFTPAAQGVSFRVDNRLKYSIIVDVDSLLFELNSVCELMTNFLDGVYSLAAKPLPAPSAGQSVRVILEAANADMGWFRMLAANRNLFAHNAAPYIAVDVTNAPEQHDLLVMKRKLTSFDDPEEFMRLSDLNDIVQGFRRARDVILTHLQGLFVCAA